MSKPYTGGCACGAIRYEISAEPIAMNDCQCRDCQTHWDMVGDSGNVKTRGFCPACGSPVYLTFSAMPDLFTIHAASLDDPGRYEPQMVTYTVRGHAWDRLDPAVPKFERMPPMREVANAPASGDPGEGRHAGTPARGPAGCRMVGPHLQ